MTKCLRLAALSLVTVLTGCAGLTGVTTAPPTLQGAVHGGQQPIAGAHVYLMEVGNSGNAGSGLAASTSNASLPALNATVTQHSDSIGAYVLTDAGGNFTITGDYMCSPGSVYYLYVVGGNTGAGINTAAGLMAGLAPCPSTATYLFQSPFIIINEVSTVATAYALAGFATDATHISTSGSPAATQGISTASLNTANLESLPGGVALATTPAGNGTVPQSTIDTIANILAACINTSSSFSQNCTALFSNAISGPGGTTATDTATAAINIAHNPGANVGTLYGLINGNAVFQPTLAAAPNDYTLGITYAGSTNPIVSSIAMDAQGSAWFVDGNNQVLTELSSTGAPVFSSALAANGYNFVAIDPSGNGWVTNANTLEKFSPNGTLAGTYTGGGLNYPDGIAIDGNGNVFATNGNTFSISSHTEVNMFLLGFESMRGGVKTLDGFLARFHCTQTSYRSTGLQTTECQIEGSFDLRAPATQMMNLLGAGLVRATQSPAWVERTKRMLDERFAGQNAEMQTMFQRDQKALIAQHKMLMANQKGQFDAGEKRAQNAERVRHAGDVGTMNSMGDVNDYRDPTTGKVSKVSNQYSHTYLDSAGNTIVQTNSAYAPGPDTIWQELQPHK